MTTKQHLANTAETLARIARSGGARRTKLAVNVKRLQCTIATIR